MPALTRTLVPLLLGLAATPAWSAPTADVPVPAPRIASGDTWLYRHTEEGQSTDILQRVVETGPDGGYVIEGQESTTRAQQRMVSLAFNTRGRFTRAYSPEGWTYADPVLPPGTEWVRDRDAFIRHALGLIGR